MAALSPTRDASEIALLLALGAAQVVEPKIAFLSSTRGKVYWIVLKLLLGYLHRRLVCAAQQHVQDAREQLHDGRGLLLDALACPAFGGDCSSTRRPEVSR